MKVSSVSSCTLLVHHTTQRGVYMDALSSVLFQTLILHLDQSTKRWPTWSRSETLTISSLKEYKIRCSGQDFFPCLHTDCHPELESLPPHKERWDRVKNITYPIMHHVVLLPEAQGLKLLLSLLLLQRGGRNSQMQPLDDEVVLPCKSRTSLD